MRKHDCVVKKVTLQLCSFGVQSLCSTLSVFNYSPNLTNALQLNITDENCLKPLIINMFIRKELVGMIRKGS